MSFQQGSVPLLAGQDQYTVIFPSPFLLPPEFIVAVVYDGDAAVEQQWIEATVVTRGASQFSVKLTDAPERGGYILSWLAGDLAVSMQIENQLGGLPVMSLPRIRELPANSIFTVVVPGSITKTYTTTLENVLSSFSGSHGHVTTQLTDTTPYGRSLLQLHNPSQAQQVLGLQEGGKYNITVAASGTQSLVGLAGESLLRRFIIAGVNSPQTIIVNSHVGLEVGQHFKIRASAHPVTLSTAGIYRVNHGQPSVSLDPYQTKEYVLVSVGDHIDYVG
jgi:hypothetical protein